jgi:hypothetical protein
MISAACVISLPVPEPQRRRNDQGADQGRYYVAQRYRDRVKPGKDCRQAEEQAAKERADKADAQIAQGAKTLTLPLDSEPRKSSPIRPTMAQTIG